MKSAPSRTVPTFDEELAVEASRLRVITAIAWIRSQAQEPGPVAPGFCAIAADEIQRIRAKADELDGAVRDRWNDLATSLEHKLAAARMPS